MKPKMSGDSKKFQNVSSSLLTQEENQKVFMALGKQCTTLSTTVVQLYLTEDPSHYMWVKKFCGVICFVRDCDRRSYFFKLFDMDRCSWIWEQELYNPFAYKPACTYFHVFEADNCMAGLNFANNEEALYFKSAVQKKIQQRDERKRERRRAQQAVQPSNVGIVASRGKSESTPSLVNGRERKKEREKRKKKLTKEDISNPTNFTHVQHVGWHPEKGFNVESVDEELKAFFNKAGVSDNDLNDCDTRNFIYAFINSHGGVERAKQEIVQKGSPPPVPVRDAPQTPRPPRLPTSRSAAPPPPPPSVPPAAQPPSVPKHSIAPPPPPPPPAPSSAPPPPPPPPPPPGPGYIPSSPKTAPIDTMKSSNPPPAHDGRAALFDQIRKGKELNHVEVGSANNSLSSGDDARGALLSQIRQGCVLKPVSEDARPVQSPSPLMEGLAGALARALQERSRAIQQTDESGSSSDEDDGDDWD